MKVLRRLLYGVATQKYPNSDSAESEDTRMIREYRQELDSEAE
jgi:hypothetical protein